MDSIKLTIDEFNNEGFEVWEHRIVNFFKNFNVWEVVNGTTTDSSGKARIPTPEEIIDVGYALDQKWVSTTRTVWSLSTSWSNYLRNTIFLVSSGKTVKPSSGPDGTTRRILR